MLRCAAPFVIAAYDKCASFLRICTPCLRTFYEVVRKSIFYEIILFSYQQDTDTEMESRSCFQYESRLKRSQRCILSEIHGITGLGTDVVLPEEGIRPSQEAIWLKRGIYGFSHVGRMGLTSI